MIFKQILILLYRQLRYIYWRYIKSRYYENCKLFNSFKLDAVSKRNEYFFGYYNISPENKRGDIVFCDLSNLANNEISIILKRNGNEIVIGKTSAFNLQQGCMLQWGYTNDHIIYYNRFNKLYNKYECVVFDTDAMIEVKVLPIPIYSLSKQEDYALSLNFERLSVMRADYGYFCRNNYELPDNLHDGIWKIDIATGVITLIISLQQLIDLDPVPSMEGANHKVNHIDISPDGNRFMFLHRWIGPQGRFMRLITADRNGEDIFILNGDIMTSHCGWHGSNHIISFCYTDKYGESYVEFVDKSKEYKLVSNNLPHVDGHPSVSPDGEWIVSDTYPQFNRFSSLYLYNFKQDKVITIGRFYQPLKFLHLTRIDLHPKWSVDGSKIYFESGHNGKRCLYVVSIDDIR